MEDQSGGGTVRQGRRMGDGSGDWDFFVLGEFGLRERRERGLGVRELGFHVGLLGRVKYFGLGWLLFWF